MKRTIRIGRPPTHRPRLRPQYLLSSTATAASAAEMTAAARAVGLPGADAVAPGPAEPSGDAPADGTGPPSTPSDALCTDGRPVSHQPPHPHPQPEPDPRPLPHPQPDPHPDALPVAVPAQLTLTGPDGDAPTVAAGGAGPAQSTRHLHMVGTVGTGIGVGPGPGAVSARPADQERSRERRARAILSRLTEPGDAAIGRSITRLGAPAVVDAVRDGTDPGLLGLSATRLAAYRESLREINPESDLAQARTLGGRFIIPGDLEWPSQLDDLGDLRPLGLWIRGSGSLRLMALRSVAVVGSRACTQYGRHVACELSAQLAERGWVVVSGAAYGVDASAHQGALAAGGMTVGILACGIDVAYPRGNSALIDRIAVQGMLVSELPPGVRPNRFRFVLRNRVIAALTRGTVVVEAALRSGALSTARRARDLNRHTMGVAGPVTSELSAGVHAMIRSGDAVLVTDAAEVSELIGSIGDDLAPRRTGPIMPRDLLEPPIARVLEAVPASADGAPVERIARQAGLTRDDTAQRLYELASLGFVERYAAHWRLVRSRA